MFESINIHNLLYLDIETAGMKKHYTDLSKEYQEAWEYHCQRNKLVKDTSQQDYEDAWQDNVALVPEYSNIICVSLGKFMEKDGGMMFKTQTFYLSEERPHEEMLLEEVKSYIEAHASLTLVAHAGKDFDYPFLIRRMIINNVLPPKCLQLLNKKPWEVNLLDTKEIWKFGGYRSASLASICAALDIPSPKADMSGKDTHPYFWDGRQSEIARYCSNDVRALASVVQRMCLTGQIDKKFTQIDYV